MVTRGHQTSDLGAGSCRKGMDPLSLPVLPCSRKRDMIRVSVASGTVIVETSDGHVFRAADVWSRRLHEAPRRSPVFLDAPASLRDVHAAIATHASLGDGA